MRHSLTLVLFTFLVVNLGYTQCSYCTSLDDAMIDPSSVKSLDLRAQSLTKFPSELNSFPNLKYLNLSNNVIDEIRYDSILLISLVELDLSNNPGFNTLELEGIGKSFPLLKRLSFASSSVRYLSGNISELRHLESLDVSNNALASLPRELGEIRRLRNIDVSNNRLSDAVWIKGLWKIQEINLGGNERLNTDEIGKALLFKDSLRVLQFTPGNTRLELSGVFASLNLTELRIVDGNISVFENGICKSKTLTKLVFDGTEIPNPQRLFEWLNRFPNLETVEFRNMEIGGELNQIQKTNEIRFVNCSITQKESLQKINPKIEVVGINSDISMDGYVGNAKVVSTGEVITQAASEPRMSEAMLTNSLPSIVEAEQTIISLPADAPKKIALDFSSYDIPSNAFLTSDGKVYEGEVTLKIKEYDNAIENALAGVPMVYRNGGTNNIFASSGMIDFRAYDESGNELKSNPENIIQVELRDLQPAENSNLYIYNEAEKNWIDIGVPESLSWEELKRKFLDSLNQLPDSDFVNQQTIPIGVKMKYKSSSKDAYRISFETVSRVQKRGKNLNNGRLLIYESNADQKQIAKSDWMIDTLISPEISDALKSMKKVQKLNERYWKKKKIDTYIFAPRLITQLHITPNFDDDNYELTFFFKDSLVSLPVLPDFSGSTSRIQAKEKKKWDDYERAKKKERKEKELMDSWKIRNEKKMAEKARERIAELMASQRSTEREQLERLRFGLGDFGLVNCDYFSRNKPSGYLRYDSTAVDLEGNWVKVPNEVRNIMLNDNSFVSTSSNSVPEYDGRKSIVLFSIGALEIAVVKGFEKLKSGIVRPIVQRISTDGVPPDEIRKKVLSAAGE